MLISARSWLASSPTSVAVRVTFEELCRTGHDARARDHMVVGEDQALVVEHDARAAVLALGGDRLDRHDALGVLLVDLGGRERGGGDLAAGPRRGAALRRRAGCAHRGRRA